MSHLALRNTKRGKGHSKSDNRFGSEFVHLVVILLEILLTWYQWIKLSFVNLHLINHRSYKEVSDSRQSEEESDSDDEPGTLVVARGIGLMAAYTGRRAMFAIYPASGEGLEVTSNGPAPIDFQYKKKDDLFLVGYVPPAAGKYKLRVARFGKKAIGSPFLLRVDDPPPGYVGAFGSSLWHERPPQPPILSGIVDFVTEKMFLTEDGRLVKLNKKGTDMEPVKDKKPVVQPAHTCCNTKQVENHFKEKKHLGTLPPEQEAPQPCSAQNYEIKKNIVVKNQVVARIENILTAINRDSKKDPQERYKYVSKALMKELSLSLKILNMLGTNAESLSPSETSPECERRVEFAIPEITNTTDNVRTGMAVGCNQSAADRFLSKEGESRYAAQRPAKLGWHWGDDAVISEPCDTAGQIESMVGSAGRREGLIGSILQGGRNARRKYGVSGLLGLRKNQEPTGVSLLQNIYRPSDNLKDLVNTKELNTNTNTNLNNKSTSKSEYHNIINVRKEKNNLEIEKRNPSIKNYSQKDVIFKAPVVMKHSNYSGKQNKCRPRELSTIGNSRTLSLPDFNRILSLSVQGLRKAKSCGDRSFKAVSSSAFTLTLKNIFDREQVYNLSNVNKENLDKARRTNNGATLIKLSHYGSDRDCRRIQPGIKSVDEWKKYWEEKQIQTSDSEFGKGCSLELTGIVDRRKAVFESGHEIEVPEIQIFDESKIVKYVDMHKQTSQSPIINGYLKPKEVKRSPEGRQILSPSPVSNKTAFDKAKDMFEGNYNKDIQEAKDNRKRSVSERFHVSSLSKDIHSGATPELLGVPNRVPVVASLGSAYHPEYPYYPLSPKRNYLGHPEPYVFPSWDMMFQSDPNYV